MLELFAAAVVGFSVGFVTCALFGQIDGGVNKILEDEHEKESI